MQIGSFSLIKELNTSIILKTIRNNNSISRADISKLTGLTPATVTNITSELLSYKLISETKLGKSNGGRKPVLLSFCYNEYNTIGVVIAKHRIIATLTDLNANIIKQQLINIDSDISPNTAMNHIITSIKNLTSNNKKKLLGIGVSIEGLVDEKKGICVFSNNFGWENVEIKKILSETFSIPVYVDNDVKALALGENFFGSAKTINDFILLYVGYGIGLCIVNNGQIYRGSSNYASEFGHTIIDANGPQCSCGNKGCFQALASGGALIKKAKSLNYDTKYFNGDDMTVDKIIEYANNGNDKLYELINEQSKYISIGLANIINIFNPSLIIINGDICKINDSIKESIIENSGKMCLKNTKDDAVITFSKLSLKEAYKGAVALLVANIFENPESFFNH